MSSFGVAFAPHLPLWLLAAFGAMALAILAFSVYRHAHGAWARLFAFIVVMLALANPLIVKETREGLSNIVALIIDRSQSMEIGTRKADAEKALAAMREKLKTMNVELREAEVRTNADAGDAGGTALFSALNAALSDAPPDRVSGAIVITDGEVHDAPDPKTFHLGAPFHVLITGAPNERDRKLTVVRATRFNIVGKDAEITFRVDDYGGSQGANAQLSLRIDGKDAGKQNVPVGKDTTIKVPVTHGGENVVELEAAPGPAEQTLQNNRAAVIVNGVRDRLRVLLVSGEPHAGERVWRNLLKADPSVDLVHFTILRPPEKQDGTPINELSLIAFPIRELFDVKLDEFDLIIFDRYSRRGVIPQAYLENVARYVRKGGAFLEAAGPSFGTPLSLSRTPLGTILPTEPTGNVYEEGFKPQLTDLGRRHPVTEELPGSGPPGGEPSWGRWFRQVEARVHHGVTVMGGDHGDPLLVLDRVGQGRVAQLLSDQMWFWARGFEGGGPQAELLRRLAYWLMKEPDLEENDLRAMVEGDRLHVTRQSLEPDDRPVSVTAPDGSTRSLTLAPESGGRSTGTLAISEMGLYRVTDGSRTALAAAGPLNPVEFADVRSTPEKLVPIVAATGGGVFWAGAGTIPDIRRVSPERTAAGRNWMGFRANGDYNVTGFSETPLLPGVAALLLIIGGLLAAWRREGS